MTEPSMECRDHRCSHHVETNADGWADDVRLSEIENNFTCMPLQADQAGVPKQIRTDLALFERPKVDAVDATRQQPGQIGLACYEEMSAYSITSLARRRREAGIWMPNDRAVVELMTNSNAVGCSMGRSLG